MNNLEYLNQISQSNRPVKPAKQTIINGGLILKILIGAVLFTAALLAFGVLANNGNTRATSLTKRLYNRTEYVNKLISDYNKSLKSSQLRSINSSLSGTLTGTSKQLAEYLTSTAEKGTKKPLTNSAEVAATEANYFANIDSQLNSAQLNGILDRHYAAQIYLQVELLMSMTSELAERDKSAALQPILTSFYENLDVIANTLENYTNKSS